MSGENEIGRSVSGHRDRETKRDGEGKGGKREKKRESVSGETEKGERVN